MSTPSFLVHLRPRKFDIADDAISLETWSDAIHVEVLTRDFTIVGAIPGQGVCERVMNLHIVDAGHYRNDEGGIVLVYGVLGETDVYWDNVIKGMRDNIGCGYSWIGDAQFAWWFRLLFGWRYNPKRQYSNGRRKWFCSEIAFEMSRRAGIALLTNISDYQVSPGIFNISPLLVLRG